MKTKYWALVLLLSLNAAMAQDTAQVVKKQVKQDPIKPLKLKLNEDGSHYVQFTGLVQTWVRYNESNPNSKVNNQPTGNTFDVGLRRVRFQLIGQLNERVFFYSQIGLNSFSYLSERKFGFFIHDALGEYEIIKKHLSFGAGLNSWVGPLRFSSPGVASIMGMDAFIYQQTTNDINDQFVRRMGVYIKGKLGKADYRFSVQKPFIVNSAANVPIPGTQAGVGTLAQVGNDISTFSVQNPSPQFNSYISYQFFDQESNKVPYNAGAYHGTRKVFNIGGGAQYQQNAMWHTEANPASAGGKDTVSTDYVTAGLDVFYDAPLNKEKGTALSIYVAYLYSNYGKNYVRNLGVMNPADGGQGYSTSGLYNSGGGSAFAINGTGNTYSAQVGYKMKNDLLGEHGTLMPYVMTQISQFYYFSQNMIVYSAGLNWLIKGHNSKFTLDYQNRPYFTQAAAGDPVKESVRRGMLVLQYQVSF